MRKLLLLALFLYNIITLAIKVLSYEYDDLDLTKRHSILEDRRNWRKNSLMKEEHKDWGIRDRRRQEYDGPSRHDDQEMKMFEGIERHRDLDVASVYRGALRGGHYEEDKMTPQGTKSAELPLMYNIDKDAEKKPMICEKPHERYEPCFAGCASVSCDNPRERLRPCYPFCEAGCTCIPPYVRDDRTHKCVLPEECTKGLKGIPDLADET